LIHARCPDALVCETIFDQVLKEVGREKMDLTLVYVAEYAQISAPEKHLTEAISTVQIEFN
jgi:hypothetical protein